MYAARGTPSFFFFFFLSRSSSRFPPAFSNARLPASSKTLRNAPSSRPIDGFSKLPRIVKGSVSSGSMYSRRSSSSVLTFLPRYFTGTLAVSCAASVTMSYVPLNTNSREPIFTGKRS